MTPPRPPDPKRMTRRAFAAFAAAGAAGYGGFAWLQTRSRADGIPWPLRTVHDANAAVGRALGAPDGRAPVFPASAAGEPKANGWHGHTDPPLAAWVAAAEWPGGGGTYSVPELLAGLPRIDEATELKCIEGWSQVVRWGGVRFADVAAKHGWPLGRFPFVSLSTADASYYVGLDAASARHPQTLLCDTMNGDPLPANHGGPLRLVIPVKYGIKSIKWVAAIRFSAARPADYWAERGYDWHAGL